MNQYIATSMLLLASIIWGTAFVAQTVGMETMGPHTFTGVRLILGGFLILPIAIFINFNKSNFLNTKTILLLVCMGFSLWMGAWLQQVALIYTEVANVAFLTALYVPLVPLVTLIIFRKKISFLLSVSVLLCILGTYLLIGRDTEIGFFGDLLAMFGAIFWSCHIILLSKAGEMQLEPFFTATTHILLAGFIGLIMAVFIEKPSLQNITGGLPELLYTGLISIGIGFTLQTIAQTYAPPTHAALVLSMETVFASLAAYFVLGQILGYYSIIGCLFIVLGVLISETSKFYNKT
jgi:drug/metabolite transporter (DMT)-like permease